MMADIREDSSPMPLKHRTETIYVVVLAVLVALSGIVLAWLPAFPAGVVPWFLWLLLMAAYPLVLSAHLKENRADYEFRWLHAFPLGMTLVWGVFSALQAMGDITFPAAGFTILWSLPIVLLGFILLGLFCISVVRCSHQRINYLSIMFGVFVALAATAHFLGVNAAARTVIADSFLAKNAVTSFFMGDDTGSGTIVAVNSSSSSVATSGVAASRNRSSSSRSSVSSSSSRRSSVSSRLTAAQVRSSRAAARTSRTRSSSSSSRTSSARSSSATSSRSASVVAARSSSSRSASSAVVAVGSSSSRITSAASSRSSVRPVRSSSSRSSRIVRSSSSSSRSSRTTVASGSSSSKPPSLPDSGGEVALLGLLLVVLYTGVVHKRAKDRLDA